MKLMGLGSKGSGYLQDTNFHLSLPGLLMINTFWMGGLGCGGDAQDGRDMGGGRKMARGWMLGGRLWLSWDWQPQGHSNGKTRVSAW